MRRTAQVGDWVLGRGGRETTADR
ncbi:MAG: hypothetical protein H6674_04450 [Dehalococcoidia bacterium]|nr:hypothetical protein [Dehalococcoidia bacterium]